MTTITRRSRPRQAASMLVLAMLMLLLGAASGRSQSFPAPERRKIQDMLDAVRKTIVEKYYDSTYGGANLQAAYDSASAHIRDAAAPDGALGAIAWFTLQLNDSHTFFAPPSQTVSVDYGWNMAMFGDSCFVISVKQESDASRQGMHLGDQVASINGVTPSRANLWQLLYVYRLLRPQPRLHVVLRSPAGDTRTLDVASKVRQRNRIVDLTGSDGGRDINQLLRDGDNDHQTMDGQFVEYGDSIGIWKMPTFLLMPDEVRDMMKRASKRKALVIDLRGNGGGYVQSMLELVKQVSSDSVVIGTMRERRKTVSLVAKSGGDQAFVGKLIVLVDSRSASASEIFARTMQLTGRGKVIGDRTAGAVMISLFHPLAIGMETKIFFGVEVTNSDIVMSDGGRLEHAGVAPDELLVPASTDLARKQDPVLARALTLAGATIDAVKAGSLFREVQQ